MFLPYQSMRKILFYKIKYLLFCILLVTIFFFNIGTKAASLTYQYSLKTIKVYNMQEHLNEISMMENKIETYAFLSMTICLLMVLLVVYIATITTFQNSRQIGVMRSIGMSNIKILISFFYEVVFLYIIVGGIGTIAIYLLSGNIFSLIDPNLCYFIVQFNTILYSREFILNLLCKTTIAMVSLSLITSFSILIYILHFSPMEIISRRDF